MGCWYFKSRKSRKAKIDSTSNNNNNDGIVIPTISETLTEAGRPEKGGIVTQHGDIYNPLPRLSVIGMPRQGRRQSDVDILYGRASIFAFNEKPIDEDKSKLYLWYLL